MAACRRCGADNPDRAKFCIECGLPVATRTPGLAETRRVVTVLFSDVVGSTTLGELLDPETMRAVMARYFAVMAEPIERHGGVVEKFVGDAVMAVFGMTELHEDDAIRAVRAALDMRTALEALNRDLARSPGLTLTIRTGINTGEVAAGAAGSGQTLVTGDPVNTAARLEQAAQPGEILLGEATWRLVRDHISVEEVPLVTAKGKMEPLKTRRLVGLAISEARSAVSTPFVGRAQELAELAAAYERSIREKTAVLVTVVGAAGVGKSRLVSEFLSGMAAECAVLRGRCLPYGDGITYWPLREIMAGAAGLRDEDSADQGIAKLEALLEGISDRPVVVSRLASAIGLGADPAARDEIFWAVRRTLTHLAERGPLVVIIEDVHWAEPTLRDLIADVASLTTGVPLTIVCTARPELMEAAGRRLDALAHMPRIDVGALAPAATDRLLDAISDGFLLQPDLRERILSRAEGNPLFLEELARMLLEEASTASVEDGERQVDTRIPPTLHALLAARIDRLPEDERWVARRASVIGRVFERDAVVELSPPASQAAVPASLRRLVARDLVSPQASEVSTGAAFQFRHILIRDAAYAALPKSERADLHEGFADWLERVAGHRVAEYEEIVGYHLAEAHRYRADLRLLDARTEEVGRRAADHLARAARRASARGDAPAAVHHYAAAAALMDEDAPGRAELMLEHALALYAAGRLAEAGRLAFSARQRADATGQRDVAARARLAGLAAAQDEGTMSIGDPAALIELEAALSDATASGDPRALAEATSAIGARSYLLGDFEASMRHTRQALAHARRAGDPRYELELETNLLVEAVVGPMVAEEVVALGTSMLQRADAYPSARADILRLLAVPEAMIERFDLARRHSEESVALAEDLGRTSEAAICRGDQSWVERLAGDLPAAEATLRKGIEECGRIGNTLDLSFLACRLAQVLVEEERIDEALEFLVDAERVPMAMNRSRVVGARARILAARRDPAARYEVARLQAMLDGIAFPNVRIDALMDAAEALAAMGDEPSAIASARDALRLAEAKGNRARAGQIRDRLARFEEAAGAR